MRNIDYKDTEKEIKVSIYGLEFIVNINEFENIDTKNLNENSDLESILDRVLGENASEKINEKRINDGYDKMNSNVALTIIAFITDMYIESTMQPINKPMNRYNSYKKKVDNIKNNNYKNRKYRR